MASTLRLSFLAAGNLLQPCYVQKRKVQYRHFFDPHHAAILGVAAIWTRFQLIYLPIMVAIYLWMGLGTTLYLHRYLTHRGFEMPGWLKFFFATGSAVGLWRGIR